MLSTCQVYSFHCLRVPYAHLPSSSSTHLAGCNLPSQALRGSADRTAPSCGAAAAVHFGLGYNQAFSRRHGRCRMPSQANQSRHPSAANRWAHPRVAAEEWKSFSRKLSRRRRVRAPISVGSFMLPPLRRVLGVGRQPADGSGGCACCLDGPWRRRCRAGSCQAVPLLSTRA